ncbi:acetyltransferase [Vibrio cholerae]|nr:acetyltransferase [Vibrio cholerae]
MVIRCQPLRRALVSLRKNHQNPNSIALKNQLSAFKLHDLVIEFQVDAVLVESVEC